MDNEKNNNVENNTPSTDSDVMPSGGSTLGQAAKQGAKKTAQKGWKAFKEAVGRGIKALWKLLPLQVKIIVIIILVIIIILAALLMMGMIKESSSVVTSGVEDYVSNANLDKDAKSLYEDKASLIKVKLKDINAMYDKFIDEDKGGAETQTLMKYSIGTKDVKEDNKEKRIVNVEDKLPLYKHILLTEKYNFNNVDWKKFSHNATAGEDIKDFKEDKERGLKYPDTTKNNAGDPKEVKLDKFIDLTLPYLQTWYIPLAMSNASVLNGTESDNNRAPAFSYNIIKEAYSNIVANWYELKKHTTVTRYYTYDEIKKHDMVTVEVIEREYENGAKNYSLRLGSSQTFEDSRTPKNTRTTSGIAGGTVDPMKEEAVSQKDEYTSHFYIKEADVFDAKIVNQFNYQVYSDADAAKRRNADSTNESIATYAKTMSTEDINKKGENAMYGLTVDSNGNISGANLDKVSRFGNAIPQNDPTNTTKRTTAYSYNVTFKQYTDYENGLEHTVTRIWKDKLSQTDSETSDYTIDDLIMYNQSDKRKEKVDATALCGEDYSASSSSGTSTGTSDPATEIKIGNYTYPVFNQGSYPNTTKHGGDTISQAGCGLCSLTVCVGGLTGKKVDPVSCGNDTNWTGPKTLAGIAADLKNVYNIDAEALRWDNRTAGGTTPAQKASLSKTKITEALKNNSPVIALIKPIQAALGTSGNGAHYITLVGLNGNKVIIANSAGGLREEYDLDWVIEKIYENANTTECGIVITKRSGSSSSSSSTSSGSTSSGSSSSSSSSNNSSSNSNRDGKGKVISTSNVNSTGYTGIYESRTTGRRFKEYKQNGNSYVFRYDISSVNCSWSSECGTVSTMIVGSGYSTKATFEDATKKLKSTGGGTQFTPWLSDYASDAKVKTINSPSQSQLKNLLKDGCVAVVHDPGYSANGHYMAILDISRDGTQIYVSNPDSYNAIQNGWNPISVFYSGGQYLTDCYFVSNKGNVTEYSGDSGDSSSTSDTTCTGTKSGKYYTSLKKTDGLNRIDFMNSNPDIFHRYIREGGEYYEYVGYSREKLKLSYWNLKDLFQKVYDKNDSLPWAYGKTLGFENIYSTSFSKYSGSSSSYKRGIFTWPVPEYVEAGKKLWDQITSTFGNRTHPITGQPGTMHNGIDIASSVNASAKIVAAADGKVVKASNTGDGYGNCVIIQHSGGYYTLYGHMSSLTVSVGDEVNKGQQIGIMGSTGNSTGNHLHFEIEKFDGDFSMSKYYSNTRLDPIDFFNEDCSPVGGGSGDLSEECIDFVWGWEGNDDYLESQGHLTSDHKYYIIYTDAAAGGNKAVGHGIDLNAGGYEAVLSKAGYSTNVGAKIPKEFVDNLSLENMSERKSEIEDKCSGLNLKDYQIDALICRSYQMGSTGWYYGDTWSYCPGETFVSAYKKWWDNGKSDRLYNNFMKYVTNGGEYGLIRRRESEWKLFKTGVYDWAH